MPPLSNRPRLLRSTIARGLAAGESAVDRTGGDSGAGLIRGMAILTVGEALGHGLWCDGVMLDQVLSAINASPKGAKARFTHPDLSGDGLGKFTGRVKNAQRDGDTLRGDLHFANVAHDAPDGDLAGYMMALAAEDPEAFGNSIAFQEDFEAEELFRLQNSQDGKFISPDSRNKKNLIHARVASLRAVDAVDDPAANPSGFFHRGDEVASDAERLLSFSLGLSAERPRLVALDLNPERFTGFVSRFLDRNGLTITKKDGTMPPTQPAAGGGVTTGMTTAQLDVSLAAHFAKGLSPDVAKRLAEQRAGKLAAADKTDRAADREERGEEEGDADEDEGHEKKGGQAGGDFAAGDTAAMASSEKGDGDDDEDDEDTTGLSAAQPAPGRATTGTSQLAAPAPKPKKDQATTPAPGDQASVQDGYQETQEEVHEGSAENAEEGTPVDSPSKEKKKGIGPLGDPSNNVGYKQAQADCRKFTKAFGPQGAVWFSEGKTFEQCQQLHIAQLEKENGELKKQNAELAAKKPRGLSKPLNAGGQATSVDPELQKLSAAVGGGGMARFAAGIAVQLRNGHKHN